MNDKIRLFVKKVVFHSGIRNEFEIKEIEEGKRISFVINSPDNATYRIRIWNTDEKGIDFTLFKENGDEMLEVMTERYYFSTGRFYKRVGK